MARAPRAWKNRGAAWSASQALGEGGGQQPHHEELFKGKNVIMEGEQKCFLQHIVGEVGTFTHEVQSKDEKQVWQQTSAEVNKHGLLQEYG